MRGKYAFTVSCLKEADDVWSLEFLSLGNPVPVNVIQHEELNQPLTDVPVVFRQEDPITYFRKLTQSVLTFLPGYHTRLLNQIRSRLARLETGEYLYAKVTYLNNGAEINSYNYEVELAKEQLVPTGARQPLPGVAPSIEERPYTAPVGMAFDDLEQMAVSDDSSVKESQVSKQLAQLRMEINSLHSELRRLKKQFKDIVDQQQPSLEEPGRSLFSPPFRPTTKPEKVGQRALGSEVLTPIDTTLKAKGQEIPTGSPSSRQERINKTLSTVGNAAPNRTFSSILGSEVDEIKLSTNENTALRLVMERGLVTESELKGLFDNPVAVMESLISKMIETNTHWIHSERSENGEWVYAWQGN